MSHKLIGLKARLLESIDIDGYVFKEGDVMKIYDVREDRFELINEHGTALIAGITSDMFEILPEDDAAAVFGAEPDPEEPCCRTCRFWKGWADSPDDFGNCRRHPPVLSPEDLELFWDNTGGRPDREGEYSMAFAAWVQPTTLHSTWCGEYERVTP